MNFSEIRIWYLTRFYYILNLLWHGFFQTLVASRLQQPYVVSNLVSTNFVTRTSNWLSYFCELFLKKPKYFFFFCTDYTSTMFGFSSEIICYTYTVMSIYRLHFLDFLKFLFSIIVSPYRSLYYCRKLIKLIS